MDMIVAFAIGLVVLTPAIIMVRLGLKDAKNQQMKIYPLQIDKIGFVIDLMLLFLAIIFIIVVLATLTLVNIALFFKLEGWANLFILLFLGVSVLVFYGLRQGITAIKLAFNHLKHEKKQSMIYNNINKTLQITRDHKINVIDLQDETCKIIYHQFLGNNYKDLRRNFQFIEIISPVGCFCLSEYVLESGLLDFITKKGFESIKQKNNFIKS